MPKIYVVTCSFALVASLSAVADIPPPPGPIEACANKQAGDSCTAFTGVTGWIDDGVCQQVGAKLACIDKRKLTENPPAVATKTEEVIKTKTNPAASGPNTSHTDSIAPEGCSTGSPASILSLFASIMGLIFVIRGRKKG
jgi:hypothetical protein